MGKKSENNSNVGMGKLFYAIILTDQGCNFGNIGLDGKRVHSINYRDIGALVSDYPRVASIKLLRKNLVPYHRVTREAAQRVATIPARFGQIARDAGEVSIALRRHYDQIRQELGRLDGKVEMGLKVSWEVENLFAYLLERDAALKARRNQLLGRGTQLNRLEQIEFGGYMHTKMEQTKKEISQRVLAALPPAETRVEENHEDELITNAVLLIRKELRPRLERAIDQIGESMGDEYRLTLEGPWPPFSFVDRVELHLSHP
jgi:hypothetical protein